MRLESISFDESDKNLFQVDDPRLRADALKHSILPRLQVIIGECISKIRSVYNIEVLEDSGLSYYPQFRVKRERDLTHLYEAAFVGLAGKRAKDKWHSMERKDGKPVQFLPFRYGFQLTEEGLIILLENYWLKGLTDESYKKIFDFHLEHEALIHILCYISEISPIFEYREDVEPISTFRKHYECMLQNKKFGNNFASRPYSYPVFFDSLSHITSCFMEFYTVYDSYIQIAMGKPIRFNQLITKLNQWIRDDSEYETEKDSNQNDGTFSEEIILKAREAAEQKVRVMPAIRWQVFQRDNWKCVSCGRSSQDGIILHVDHITPRSKGGKDTLENYQTLCDLCNIGKSNKDSTNLRERTF